MFVRNHLIGRRGFTLVELLVVIGIIMVLIAVLLPAIVGAKKHAQRTYCAANLHSIGQALVLYTQLYGRYTSMEAFASPDKEYAIWPTRLRMLMGGDTAAFNCPAQDERTRWVKGAKAGPMQPAATDVETWLGYEPGEALLMKYSSFFSYGYNWFGWCDASEGEWDLGLGEQVNLWKPFDPTGHEFPASKVRNPSQMIAIADSTADGQSDYGIRSFYGAPQEWPGKVHGGGANVLFCDGHVQWYLQRELVPEKLMMTRFLPMSRMWNNDNRHH